VRAARFAVQDPLAAVNAADAAGRGPGEAGRVVDPRIPARARRGNHGGFLANALERLGVGRNRLRGQAIDAFDLVLARCDGQDRDVITAVSLAHL
jgi:hypothetical protein